MASILGDKPINRIGFGAMQLSGPGVFGPPRDPEGARAVNIAAGEIELGDEDLHRIDDAVQLGEPMAAAEH